MINISTLNCSNLFSLEVFVNQMNLFLCLGCGSPDKQSEQCDVITRAIGPGYLTPLCTECAPVFEYSCLNLSETIHIYVFMYILYYICEMISQYSHV